MLFSNTSNSSVDDWVREHQFGFGQNRWDFDSDYYSEREGVTRLGTRLASEKPISRSLLAPILPDRELQTRNVSLNSVGLRQRDLSQACRNPLVSPEREWRGTARKGSCLRVSGRP